MMITQIRYYLNKRIIMKNEFILATNYSASYFHQFFSVV